MAISVAFSGSETVTTTEHSLTTDTAGPDVETSDGVFQAFINLGGMETGDELQLRVYEKVGSGSTQRIVWEHIIRNLPGANERWVSPALMLLHGWDITADAIAGVTIPISWSIRKVA